MIKRGQIYFIRSNRKEQGSEMWGDRPAVIVSCDELAETSPTVQLCYMTTRPKKDLPTHFITEGGGKTVYGNMRAGIDSKYRSRGRIDRRMQPGGNALIRSMLAQVVGA